MARRRASVIDRARSASLRASPGRRFAAKYIAVAAALFSIYVFPYDLFGVRGDWLSGYLIVYARVAGGVLALFEENIVVTGTQIIGRYPLQMIRNCDAAEVKILFASAVLACPAPFKRQLVALVLGVGCLAMANVMRICSLFYVGVYAPGWFRVAHEEIWPLVLVAAAAVSFLGWSRYLGGAATADRAR